MSYKNLATVHNRSLIFFTGSNVVKNGNNMGLVTNRLIFFKENGFLANVKMLDEKQIATIKSEIEQLPILNI